MWVLGIRVENSPEEVRAIQEILTKYGCSIRTRLGLHDPEDTESGDSRLILLQLTGNPEEFPKLEEELMRIGGIQIRKMVF